MMKQKRHSKNKRHTKNKQNIEIQARIYAFGIVFYTFVSLLAAYGLCYPSIYERFFILSLICGIGGLVSNVILIILEAKR